MDNGKQLDFADDIYILAHEISVLSICLLDGCASTSPVFLNVERRKFLGGNYKIANRNHCLITFFCTLIFRALETKKGSKSKTFTN